MAEINFFWDPLSDNILQERDETGAVTAEYTAEPGLYGNIISQNRGGVESQFHYDAQGSTLAVTDDNQNVTDTFAYTAFGEVTERTGTTQVPFQYIGQQGYYTDNLTGQIIARRRVYEPERARWLSSDPKGSAVGDENLWTYVRNQPTYAVDPSGLEWGSAYPHGWPWDPNKFPGGWGTRNPYDDPEWEVIPNPPGAGPGCRFRRRRRPTFCCCCANDLKLTSSAKKQNAEGSAFGHEFTLQSNLSYSLDEVEGACQFEWWEWSPRFPTAQRQAGCKDREWCQNYGRIDSSVFADWDKHKVADKPCPGMVGPISFTDLALQVSDKTFGIEVVIRSAPACKCAQSLALVRLVQTIAFDRRTGELTKVELDEVEVFGAPCAKTRSESERRGELFFASRIRGTPCEFR